MKQLQLPLSEKDVRELALGENVLLTGTIYTARDAAHKYLAGQPDSARVPDLRGGVLYHCGPVIVRKNDSWLVTAAGPTTSIREEPYEATLIEKFGLRAIIGKGGMGQRTLDACKTFGCVYLTAVGGAAQVIANSIQRVSNVYMYEEFGAPEALWELQVVEMPLIVTMDAHGNSLYAQVQEHSQAVYQQLAGNK